MSCYLKKPQFYYSEHYKTVDEEDDIYLEQKIDWSEKGLFILYSTVTNKE